jgi:hypothetical protein
LSMSRMSHLAPVTDRAPFRRNQARFCFFYCTTREADQPTCRSGSIPCCPLLEASFQARTGVAAELRGKKYLDARLRQLPALVAGLFSDALVAPFCGRVSELRFYLDENVPTEMGRQHGRLAGDRDDGCSERQATRGHEDHNAIQLWLDTAKEFGPVSGAFLKEEREVSNPWWGRRARRRRSRS